MQATVHDFDPDTTAGSVLLDDGTEVPFDANAFAAGGLLMLRKGQRVRIAVEGGGTDATASRISAITLATFPLP